MGVTAAWDRGATGQPGVRIAIVDSGVDLRHPDLAGKVVGTYNAVVGGTDVRDVVGHGTGTASAAAARTNDGVGIAGVRPGHLAAGRQGRRRDRADLHRRPREGHRLGRRQRRRHREPQPRRAHVRPPGEGRRRLRPGTTTCSSSPRRATKAPRPSSSPVRSPASSRSAPPRPPARPGRRSPATARGSTSPLRAGRSRSPAPGGGYEVADGTSYSAPLVSGSAALLLAARPGQHRTRARAGHRRRHRRGPARLRARPGARRPVPGPAGSRLGALGDRAGERQRGQRSAHGDGDQLAPRGCGSAWPT